MEDKFELTMEESEFRDLAVNKIIFLEAKLSALEYMVFSEFERNPNINISGLKAIFEEHYNSCCIALSEQMKQKYKFRR